MADYFSGMKNKIFSLLFFTIICHSSHAQIENAATKTENSPGYKNGNFYDLTFSIGQGQNAPSLGWSHLYGIGKKRKIQIGYGVRFTSYSSTNKEYITAPAKLTSLAQGPQIFFDGTTHPENLDTLSVFKSQVNMLNLSIHLGYRFSSKWDAGFNIDAVGFSFGKTQSATYNSYQGVDPRTQETAKPTTLNALLVSDNDIGSLNSEFFGRYWITQKIGVRLGYTFLFSEYSTTRKLNFDNDRFRYKSSMVLVGITYNPFRL